MTRVMNRCWIAVGCLLVGVFGGAAGAQVAENARRVRVLDTGLFHLKADDRASFYVTLKDNASNQPTDVRLQFFDHAGAPATTEDVKMQAGQSTRVQISGPGFFRAHAEVLESAFPFSSQPTVLGTVEVLNVTTAQKDPVCTVHDGGVDVGRQ